MSSSAETMDLNAARDASAVAAVADGECTVNEQRVHMAETRLRVSGAIGRIELEAERSLLQAARVGGSEREHAAPATNAQKLRNARLNAAISRCMPLEHHLQSSTSSTEVLALRLPSESCEDESVLARLHAAAPRNSLKIKEEPTALESHTAALEARAANERAAAICTGSSRPKHTAENIKNKTAWRSLIASGVLDAANRSNWGANSSATQAHFITGVSALASG